MRAALAVFFVLAIVGMAYFTVTASLERSVFAALDEPASVPWFHATLADAYFAFLTIYLWVAYKERRPLARIVWLLLFLALGTFAFSAYALRELYRLEPGESFATLLTRRYG